MDGPHAAKAEIPVTRTIATYVTSSKFEDVPTSVKIEGKRALVNWFGGALGGAHHPAISKALEVLAPASASGEAQIIGRELRVDAMLASLINSMSASVHVYDDTHPSSVAHPTSPVAAATLAVAERVDASGAYFLHALILGIEIMCRVSNMLTTSPGKSHIGLFMTGMTGGIGSAVAAGKLLGLDENQLAWAIGTAAAQAAGIRVVHGTDATPFMPGVAARAGVTAALLAAHGFTSSPTSLEGARGFGDVFADPPNFAVSIEGLGDTFELATLNYKPYPCGIVAHPIIDACLDIAAQPGFSAAAIRRLDLRVHPVAPQLTGVHHPKNGMQSHNSLYHWAAAALLRGRAGIDEESDACVADPQIAKLRDAIFAEVDPSLAMDQCDAVLHLDDGSVFRAHVEHGRGSTHRPMTDDELDAKYSAQAAHVLDEPSRAKVLGLCRTIDELTTVQDLTRLCVPSQRARR